MGDDLRKKIGKAMSLLDVIKKVDASANKAGACLIGQYLVDKSNEGEQSLHKKLDENRGAILEFQPLKKLH